MNQTARIPRSSETLQEEQQLLRAVLLKDRKATAEFVARYSDAIYSYVRRRTVPNTQVVEDLVQEIFLAAWRNMETFHGDSITAWLLGIAKHKVEDYYRSRLRGVEIPSDDVDVAVLPMLEEQIDGAAQRAKIEQTLAQLPERYAVVLLGRYVENRSIREMAELSGKTEKAVERLLARARQQFRRRWIDVQS